MLDRDVERLGGRDGLGHRDHVEPRDHHLAGDRVSELDDRLDELALLVLDHVLFDGDIGEREQLLLRDERPLLQALAGEDDVRQPDEPTRDHPDGREGHERRDRSGDEQR